MNTFKNHMLLFVLTSMLVATGPLVHGQQIPLQTGMNYIITHTLLKEGVKNKGSVNTLPVADHQQEAGYFDGLGRPIQSVIVQGSPLKKDIVQPIDYDNFGRQPYEYLPYVSPSANGSYKPLALDDGGYTNSEQYKFYNGQAPSDVAGDAAPYALKKFEPSPLNRVLEQGAPGISWQPEAGNDYTGRTVKLRYEVSGNNVRLWNIVNDLPHTTGYYTVTGNDHPLTLLVTEDEEGNETKEYTDKLGRTILKEVRDSGASGGWLQTYYVYDDFGNLRYVFPPKASQGLGVSYTPASADETTLKALAFHYHYDSRQRMEEKKVPGADPVLMVYDNWDRLVLTQDGLQRKRNEWSFTKYDHLNRPAVTGTYIDTRDVGAIRSDVKDEPNRYELTGTGVLGYTQDRTYPTNLDGNSRNYLTVTYYDDYDFLSAADWGPDYDFTPELSHTAGDKMQTVRGQVTGSKVKVLETNTWLRSVTYYDDRYRVIQAVTENYVGGTDRVTSEYNFPGWMLQSLQTHTSGSTHGMEQLEILKTYDYDHTGRLLHVFHKVGDQPKVLMSANEYNELGELTEKNLHATNLASPVFKQSVDYRYNIRGWLKSLNDSKRSGTGININDPQPDYFGMELIYEQILTPGQ